MFALLLTGWLALATAQEATVGPAHADETTLGLRPLPSEAEIKRMDPGQYNDLLIDADYAMLEHSLREFRGAQVGGDAASQSAFFMQMIASLNAAAERAAKVPPYKKDPSLRDALVATYREWAALCQSELDHIELMFAVLKNDDAVERYEAVRAPLDARWSALDGKVLATQEAFAKRHRLVLTEAEAASPEVEAYMNHPAFAASGLPPDGSKLEAQDWAGLAIEHHNALLDLQNALVDVGNAVAGEQDLARMEAARADGLAKTRELRAEIATFGPLAGDSAWVEGLAEYAAWQVAILEGDWLEVVEAASRKRPRPKDVDLVNGIGNAFVNGTNERLDAMERHRQAMADRFHFAAYEAWAAERMDLLEKIP